MPSTVGVIISIGILLLIVLVIFTINEYSKNKRKLLESAELLEDALSESVVTLESTVTKIGLALGRLIDLVKQWFLSWLQELSKGTTVVINAFGTVMTNLGVAIIQMMSQVDIARKYFIAQFEKWKYNLGQSIKWNSWKNDQLRQMQISIYTTSGYLWLFNKLFCVLFALGSSFVTFFTETVAIAFQNFYEGYVKSFIDGITGFFTYIFSGKIFTDFRDKLEQFADYILELIEDQFSGWANAIVDFFEDLWNEITSWF